MMDVLAASPPEVYTHLTVNVATDPSFTCSISNSCLFFLQRKTHGSAVLRCQP